MRTEHDSELAITLNEVARRLGICRRSIEREIARDNFPRPIKIGRSTRILVADLAAYLEWLKKPTARREYLEASVSKQGALIASGEILGLITKVQASEPAPSESAPSDELLRKHCPSGLELTDFAATIACYKRHKSRGRDFLFMELPQAVKGPPPLNLTYEALVDAIEQVLGAEEEAP